MNSILDIYSTYYLSYCMCRCQTTDDFLSFNFRYPSCLKTIPVLAALKNLLFVVFIVQSDNMHSFRDKTHPVVCPKSTIDVKDHAVKADASRKNNFVQLLNCT